MGHAENTEAPQRIAALDGLRGLAIAELSHRLVEAPALRMRGRAVAALARRRDQRAAPSAVIVAVEDAAA